MELRDRAAIVTGGASGLGFAAARALLERGARVVLVDRDADGARAAARRLGDGVHAHEADVCDEAAVRAALERAAGELGPLVAAVHCAGVLRAGRVLGRDGPFALDVFRRVVETNLVGTFNVARLAAQFMAGNPPAGTSGERGVIVNTSSIAAFEGQVGQVAYSASKGGVASMTLPLARDLSSLGIRVNAIAPGVFETAMMEGATETVRRPLLEAIPFPKRFGEPEEFAALVVHVVENPYLNGAVLRLDAGLRMPPR
jgi:NAD(P)-dependent dehydrogenase (short-subunit alcohol dehydrogenase family)